MANSFDVLADLKTLYGSANFVHTNVSGLTGDPTVQTKDDGLDVNAANGNLQLLDASFIRFEYLNETLRNEVFHARMNVFYPDNLTTLREMVGEIDRLNNAQNFDITRTYEVYIADTDDRDTEQNGRMELILEFTYIWVTPPR